MICGLGRFLAERGWRPGWVTNAAEGVARSGVAAAHTPTQAGIPTVADRKEWLTPDIRDVVGYQGALVFDTSYPDGTPRKLVDSAVLRSLGWQPQVGLREGVQRAYAAYCAGVAAGLARGHSG